MFPIYYCRRVSLDVEIVQHLFRHFFKRKHYRKCIVIDEVVTSQLILNRSPSCTLYTLTQMSKKKNRFRLHSFKERSLRFTIRNIKQNKIYKIKKKSESGDGRNSLTESNSVCEVLPLKDNRMNACAAHTHTHTRAHAHASRRLCHTLLFFLTRSVCPSHSLPHVALFPRFLSKSDVNRSFIFYFY